MQQITNDTKVKLSYVLGKTYWRGTFGQYLNSIDESYRTEALESLQKTGKFECGTLLELDEETKSTMQQITIQARYVATGETITITGIPFVQGNSLMLETKPDSRFYAELDLAFPANGWIIYPD